MKIEGPTLVDFVYLEQQAAEYDALDKVALKTFQEGYHAQPPEQFCGTFDSLEPTVESHAWASEMIEAAEDLSVEQRAALRSELDERWRSEVLKLAGEGFND